MGARFHLSFQSDKLLLTQETYSTTVPELSTYAIIGGLGVLGLAVFRRRRKKKPLDFVRIHSVFE
jgi:LPXTG-motif cell wall-anchored protein